jgi:hypothetical protein
MTVDPEYRLKPNFLRMSLERSEIVAGVVYISAPEQQRAGSMCAVRHDVFCQRHAVQASGLQRHGKVGSSPDSHRSDIRSA